MEWPTTNGTTPYVIAYWNAEKEPVVVEMQPATPMSASSVSWRTLGSSGSRMWAARMESMPAEALSTSSQLLSIVARYRPATSCSVELGADRARQAMVHHVSLLQARSTLSSTKPWSMGEMETLN
jgi:hypothetical protein